MVTYCHELWCAGAACRSGSPGRINTDELFADLPPVSRRRCRMAFLSNSQSPILPRFCPNCAADFLVLGPDPHISPIATRMLLFGYLSVCICVNDWHLLLLLLK